MESQCISNHALLESTSECMKVIENVMKGIKVEEGEEYHLSPNEKWVLVRERIRALILEMSIYLHPRKSLEEINILRNRESVLVSLVPSSPPPPPPPPLQPPPPLELPPLQLSKSAIRPPSPLALPIPPPEFIQSIQPLRLPIEVPTITVTLMSDTSSANAPKRNLFPSTIHCVCYGKA
jgi:hypothetical protein